MSVLKAIEITEALCSLEKVYQNFTLFDYLHGRCHLFALAIHEETGFDIVLRWDIDEKKSHERVNGKVLVHAFCKVPKSFSFESKYVDARGGVTLQVIRRSYPGVSIHTEIVSSTDELYMFSHFFGMDNKGEINALRKYIRKNGKLYGITD